MPSRYSQAYDYDSTLDSPTVRSSVSTQHVDDDHLILADRGSDVSAHSRFYAKQGDLEDRKENVPGLSYSFVLNSVCVVP